MKRMAQFVSAVAVVAALVVGCSGNSPRQNGGGDAGADGDGGLVIVIPDAAPSAFAAGGSAALFAIDHVPQFDFIVPEGQWRWLQANALKEEYVPAEANFEGQSAGLIGLRFKGNYGTLVGCFDPTGKLTCSKLSFKIDFAEYDPSNRFYGLKKINLHSMVNDPTKLHEKLSYDLFRVSGVHAPRSSWANVRVNGVSYGVFSLVEEIDGRFTEDRWPGNGDGNLYKEAWPSSTTPESYVAKLETNETTADTSVVATFASELAAAPPDALAATLARWTDVPTLHRYMAVDDAIFNCDGVTALYSSGARGQSWGNHNFFLYQEQNRNFFWVVPWDLDSTMFACTPFAAVPPWTTTPADCSQNYGVWGGAWVKPPGCDRVFQALAQDRTGYQAAVDTLLAGPFATQTLIAQIDHWSTFIRPSLAADPTAAGEMAWMAAVDQLKSTIPVLRERALAMRDGKSPTPLTVSPTGTINDFEQTTPLGVALGVLAVANANTDLAVALDTAAPQGGQKQVRADFIYRDPGQAPSQAFGHWIYVVLPFTGGYSDLTGATRIRMMLRSDRARTIRLDLESDVYVAANAGIKFGWEVLVNSTSTQVDLLLSNAALPAWASVRTDSLAAVLKHVNGIAFNPAPVGRGGSGFLGADKSDPGFLEIDDVQVVTAP